MVSKNYRSEIYPSKKTMEQESFRDNEDLSEARILGEEYTEPILSHGYYTPLSIFVLSET